MLALIVIALGFDGNMVSNPGFDASTDGKTPDGYALAGGAKWTWVGYRDENVTPGVSLSAASPFGSLSQTITGLNQSKGRWLRFTFRGLAEENFKLANEKLYMKISFLAKSESRDSAERLIYREITRDREHFTANGNGHKAGAAVWRTYAFEELIPFREVDGVKVTIGFEGGSAKSAELSSFFVDDLSLTQSDWSSDGKVDPALKGVALPIESKTTDGMIALGGRWFYLPGPHEGVSKATVKVTYENADRLFYRADKIVAPFANSMTSWLRKGHLDLQGNLVREDRFLPDEVVITFDETSMIVKTKNVPNHPTAKFPDTYGTQGYNPSYIQEHADTYYLPLDPVKNEHAISMTAHNENYALPMGAVGVAVNGVIFYNPFDAGMQDASSIMDRCCGHPSPDNRYHYHKYPICVNTAFIDKGETHSPIIGFAFDGLPVYGPYESAGVMAKEAKGNPLNAFNAHFDKERGWHYHVTPGKFPYIIGGYFGKVDMRNFRRGPRG